MELKPTPVAAQCKVWVYVSLLAGSWFRIPPEHGCLSPASVVFCETEVSASGRSLVHSTPTDCDVPEGVRGAR